MQKRLSLSVRHEWINESFSLPLWYCNYSSGLKPVLTLNPCLFCSYICEQHHLLYLHFFKVQVQLDCKAQSEHSLLSASTRRHFFPLLGFCYIFHHLSGFHFFFPLHKNSFFLSAFAFPFSIWTRPTGRVMTQAHALVNS